MAACALLTRETRDSDVAQMDSAMPGVTLSGDCAGARPEEGMTVTEPDSIRRTLPWRIVALTVVCLLAVDGWATVRAR